ncbi:unnamed protein product [Brassicogethes aeneus]|uniref:Uncharacterized protein n=1 Tax=Brassicogethes aeneus TaxID=1431903 RepID=A0A9P0BJE7_BRAAE|nr:unnamed protein product [Brassicogethes aeneus]
MKNPNCEVDELQILSNLRSFLKCDDKESENPENKEVSSNEESDAKIGSSEETSGFSGENSPLVKERVEHLNPLLRLIGSSPIKKANCHKKKDGPDDLDDDDDTSILKTLQESFNSTADRTHKIKILTIFRHWSYQKNEGKFPTATRHMISVAKSIAKHKGILSDPSPKRHPSLAVDAVNTIVSFFQSDDHTQLMPGRKDYVSVKVNDQKVQMQKRLLLNNLKELYEMFTNTFPEIKCSFSKFASLRPKYCVLAGASGTHSVCVCPIHENVKLLIDGANLKSITTDSQRPLKNYKDCLDRMVCHEKSTKCFLSLCDRCPGVTNIIEQLEKKFEEKYVESITYKQWVTTERTSLQTLISSVDEFLEFLSNGLCKLLVHSFLVNKQRDFLNEKKSDIMKNECIVICDFSENYAFVIQNSVQAELPNIDCPKTADIPFLVYCSDISGLLAHILNIRDLNDDFHVKIGIDSGGGSLKVCLTVMPENDPEYLLETLDLNSICGVCSYTFAADLKLLMILLGLQSNSSAHPCPWCEINAKDLKEKGLSRTISSITKQSTAWKANGKMKMKAKFYKNCVYIPLIIGDEETPVLRYLPPPELHLLLGIVQKLYDSLKYEFPEVASEWVRQASIDFDHFGKFNGNNSRNLLKKVDILEIVSPGTIAGPSSECVETLVVDDFRSVLNKSTDDVKYNNESQIEDASYELTESEDIPQSTEESDTTREKEIRRVLKGKELCKTLVLMNC